MPSERARNYIERLPEIIQREEEDISHLDAEMVEILYPARASNEFTVTLVFGPPVPRPETSQDEQARDLASYERAVAIAEKAPAYRRDGRDRTLRHFATFGIDQVETLHELFSLVGEKPGSEVLIKGKRVPYARELWLPFFWFFVRES